MNSSILGLIKKSVQAEMWWNSNSNYRLMNSGDVENIMKNACYYFCSYYLDFLSVNNNDEFSKNELFGRVFLSLKDKISYINDRKEKGKELTSNDFKSNALYENVLDMLVGKKN